MSKIIESKIKKLQELQAIENQFDEAIQDACTNLMAIDNAIKELNGTRFERKNKLENEALEPVKKGGKA